MGSRARWGPPLPDEILVGRVPGHSQRNTFVEIQTRTGNQLSEEYHYFNKGGVEVADEAARRGADAPVPAAA